MDNVQRIKMTSEKLRKASSLLLWITPALCALYWACFNELPEVMKAQPGIPGQAELTVLNKVLCFMATMVPAGVAMHGFAVLRGLFGLYATGEIFSERNVACYRKLGSTLLYWAGAVFVHTSLISLAVSVGMPKGQRHLTIAGGPIELAALFAGAVALVVSWVMDEARRIEEEQSLTI
jgi:hypothetical protein